MLYADKGLQQVATVGQVLQYPYDPYRPERARMEEFGDVLAEGTYWLLDQGKFVSDGDLAHWRDFLAKRKKFIERVFAMVEHSPSIEPSERARMAAALRTALGRLALITPQLCVAYLEAWAADQERWQRYIQGVQQQPQQREWALRSLARRGGAPLNWCTYMKCSLPEPAAKRLRAPVSAFRPLLPGEFQPPMTAVPPLALPPGLLVAVAASPLRFGLSHPAHALEATEIALASQEGQAEGDDYGDEHPSEQLHEERPLPVGLG
jgi:hypothetical protein